MSLDEVTKGVRTETCWHLEIGQIPKEEPAKETEAGKENQDSIWEQPNT